MSSEGAPAGAQAEPAAFDVRREGDRVVVALGGEHDMSTQTELSATLTCGLPRLLALSRLPGSRLAGTG